MPRRSRRIVAYEFGIQVGMLGVIEIVDAVIRFGTDDVQIQDNSRWATPQTELGRA